MYMIYALIAVVTLISLILLLLRTNTGVVFLAVCAGSVLLSAAGKDTDLLAHSFSSGKGLSSNIIQATLMLLPGIISAFVLMKRVPRRKLFLAVIPALASALVGLTLVYPFLNGTFQDTLVKSKGWSLLVQYYEPIVVLGIVSSLATIVFTMPRNHKESKHKKSAH